MAVMTNVEFASKLKDIAENYKTLYVMGCFGAPMNAKNKLRYCKNHEYNRRPSRTEKIEKATADTFGFDCVCLVKGVLWGWNGDKTKTYGGAEYCGNNVSDLGTDKIIAVCKGVSTDFNNIEIGELLWMQGHVGVYIGDGLAVECTPSWQDKVQITACNRTIKGYKRRNWVKHGKLPYLDYLKDDSAKPSITVWDWQKAAVKDGFEFPKYGCDGEWGAECEGVAKKAVCKKQLVGYKYPNLTMLVQKAVGVTVDGKFGKDTKAAVIKWQKIMGLVADGAVGINTWKKILGVK